MVNAVSIRLAESQFAAIPIERGMPLHAGANEHGSWLGVDYLILCTEHVPTWVAKVEEIVIPRTEGAPLTVRFSEVRSVFGQGTTPEYQEAFKMYRNNGWGAFLSTFENDLFFTIGDPVAFKVRPNAHGLLNMENAIDALADTYGVSADQVEITIRSKPRLAANT
jgi:hypothetical protein